MSRHALATPQVRPHHPLAVAILLAALVVVGCQGKSSKGDPTAATLPDAPHSIDPAIPLADQWGEAALTVISGVVYPDGTIELDEPERSPVAVGDTYDLDATEFFTMAPCNDCATLGGISRDGSGNIHLPFTIRHPFDLGANGRYDLHIFDVRGILISEGSSPFPGVGAAPINTGKNSVADQFLVSDPDLVLNADGYTTYFDWQAANPDYGHPRDIPGNLNPFKRYFVDETNSPFDPTTPSGWNVMPMGSPEETQEFILSGARLATLGSAQFAFVLDVCYGASATRPTRGNPTYYLPEFSRKEPWDVAVEVISNNLQVGDKTSRAVIEVTPKDWQELAIVNGAFPANQTGGMVRYASKIKEVIASIPGLTLNAPVVTAPTSGGGSIANPWRYRLTLRNDLQDLTMGERWGLVAVRDGLYQVSAEGPQKIPAPATPGGSPREGLNIRDYSAYQFFRVNVGPAIDDPPIADLSLTTPRNGLTGISITLNGALSADDVGITTWEFDPEGTGTFIDNTAAIPPWNFAHVYTTPPNTQTIYNAALRVTDTSGQPATVSIPISITTTPDAPPVAVITPPAAPWEIFTGDTTTINGSASSDDFGIIKYEMNPGDGTGWIDNGLTPTLNHTYNAPGVTTSYTVELRVTDTAMQTATTSRVITVIVVDDPPVAALSALPLSGDAPLDVLFDASASTDDVGIVDYRFNPGDGSGWSLWQPGATFNHTYIPFIDTTFNCQVEVRDGSMQVDGANIDIDVTVPGGCLITGVTGPAALNVGESANYSVVGVSLVVYQWTESDPSIQFVGPTNGPTVTVLATAPSASLGSTSFTISGNGGTCTFDKDITAYDLVVIGPAHDRQYVNRDENGNDTDAIGRRATVTAAITPALSGRNVTFNFTDPDEPSYSAFDDTGAIVTLESDVAANDNRGDVRRPDGTANPLEPGNAKYQNGYAELPGPVFVHQTIVATNVIGSASAVFQTSGFGGDNYGFAASSDPAGNGFQLTRTASGGTLTVWRWYGLPTYVMENSGGADPLFYFPIFSSTNTQFAPAYVEFNFSTPSAPSAPTPQGYGNMLYTSPIDATFAAQTTYVDTVGNYGAPGEAYTLANGNKVKPNIFVFGLNEYNPAGVIGLNTRSFNPALVPPPGLAPSQKPVSTTDYVGVARGRMDFFGFNAVNQSKVMTHELGHALGLPHSDTGSAGVNPDTYKVGAAGVGIMRPSVNTGEAALWTTSEIDFLRGIDRDLVNNNIMRGCYYEGG